MKELARTNDIVLLGAMEALLEAADIGHMVADAHISALEGSIGILPRRLLVVDEDAPRARRLLADAGWAYALLDAG
ncbi:putative signal transducing protein [Xanthobacter pseudotagetidis]|uniref:putative signal transducing protein n=1 Tax=Xanthobacter pseudotagetidis TaxID=3119911 RepID=UPI0037293E0D